MNFSQTPCGVLPLWAAESASVSGVSYSAFVFQPFLSSSILIVVLVTGCSTTPSLVAGDVVEMVNEQGRERTYDLLWQDIRRFEGALERRESANFDEQVEVILSRINRLAEGKATRLKEGRYREVVNAAEREAFALNAPARHQLLHETATKMRTAFDAGRFHDAQELALQALGYSQALGAIENGR